MFETLISLTILSLVLVVSVAALRGPSPAILLARTGAQFQKDAAIAREQAIRNYQPYEMPVGALSCDQETRTVWFFADGSARGPDICLTEGGHSQRLVLNALLGRYAVEESI